MAGVEAIVLTVALGCAAAMLGCGALAVLLARSPVATPVVYGLTAVLCAVALANALGFLIGDPFPLAIVLPLGLPWLGAHFALDPLAAFFLVVVNLGGFAASAFGLGYGRHEESPARVLPFYAAFLAGMNLVVVAADAFVFLFAWEFMSLASWALVMARHRDPESAPAAYVYFVMASAGTFALLLAFGVAAGADGAYTFAAIRDASFAPLASGAILVLALIGAGSKAGVVPLHAWLPLAHPAAPSHVSALMSGVMTKVAIYGLVRVVFDLLGEPVWWWGLIVLALGGVTAVTGVLFALMQHDLKRLLAYHTVENIGIIVIGLGLALAFRANGVGWAAALALTAALFHVLNHSLFKSLLFFGSGAIAVATGERNLERLGGLIRGMPVTAFAFLIGSAAISALPPLNGFVSEWLTFQAILVSPTLPQWGLKLLIPAVGAMLALSAALAAACFVKAFGSAFLGRARSDAAERATEVDRFSLAAMLGLALLCGLVGIAPVFVIDALAPAVRALIGEALVPQASQAWLTLVPIAAGRSSYNGLLVLAFIVLAGLATAFAVHRLGSRVVRRGPAWDCGFPDPSPATQYTAESFAQPIRRVFAAVFLARERVDLPRPGDNRPAVFRVDLKDLVWEVFYAPVAAAVRFMADRLNPLQYLTIRRYLSLVFGALVGLLTILALWQ